MKQLDVLDSKSSGGNTVWVRLPPRAPGLLVLVGEEYRGTANGWLSHFYFNLIDSLFPYFQQLATQPRHLDTPERIEEMTTTLHRRQIF